MGNHTQIEDSGRRCLGWTCWVVCLLVFTTGMALAEPEAARHGVEKSGQSNQIDGDAIENELSGLTFVDGKVILGLLAEIMLGYIDIANTGDKDSGGLWDAYLGTIGVSLEMIPAQWLRAVLVAEREDLYKSGESGSTTLSEAFLTLQHPKIPVYLIAGKRAQPFGVFEDYLISGTLTEDIYEIVATGVTLGAAVDKYDLDLSITAYKGQEVIRNLEDFNTHEFKASYRKQDRSGAFIANVVFEPVTDTIELSAFYNSEPGDERRNESIGGAFSYTFLDCMINYEIITALRRESGSDGVSNMESAWLLGIAYRPLTDLQLAVRYEQFHDDRAGQQEEVVEHRYLGGFNYDVTEYAILSFEYRHTKLERPHDSETAGQLNEVRLQLAVEF